VSRTRLKNYRRLSFPLFAFSAILVVAYFYFIFTVYEYHDTFYRFSYEEARCMDRPQTAAMVGYGRPLSAIFNCFVVQNNIETVSDSSKVRFISFVMLVLLLILIYKFLINFANFPSHHILIVFVCAGVYGIQEAIFWTTASFIILGLIFAILGLFLTIYSSSNFASRTLATIFLLTSMLLYQFSSTIYISLALILLLNKSSSADKLIQIHKGHMRFVYPFFLSSVAYLLTIYQLQKLEIWPKNFEAGERSFAFSPVATYFDSYLNHLFYALHLFGPWVPLHVVLILIFLSLFLAGCTFRIVLRFVFLVLLGILIIDLPLIVSTQQTMLFRVEIPAQIFIILLFFGTITSKRSAHINRMKLIGLGFSILTIFSLVLTYKNVVLPLRNEFQLVTNEFEKHRKVLGLNPCSTLAQVNPKTIWPLGRDMPLVTDEYGSYTLNFWQDVPWFFQAVKKSLDPAFAKEDVVLQNLVKLVEVGEVNECSFVFDLDKILGNMNGN
jgi:hypothetical protein